MVGIPFAINTPFDGVAIVSIHSDSMTTHTKPTIPLGWRFLNDWRLVFAGERSHSSAQVERDDSIEHCDKVQYYYTILGRQNGQQGTNDQP